MSGILKHKGILCFAAIIAVAEFSIVLFIRSRSLLIALIVLDLLFFASAIIDLKVYKAMRRQMNIFYAQSKNRNVDCLIIGEVCDPKDIGVECESFVQIRNPGLSEEGAYQILRRTHSILKENGHVIIALESKNVGSKKLGMMDTFFMHKITIKEKKLERTAKCRILLFFIHPLKSFEILSKKYKTGFNLSREGTGLAEFSRERGLNYNLYVK